MKRKYKASVISVIDQREKKDKEENEGNKQETLNWKKIVDKICLQ